MKAIIGCIVGGLLLLLGPQLLSGNASGSGSIAAPTTALTTTFPETLPEVSTIPLALPQPSTSTSAPPSTSTSTTATTTPVDRHERDWPVTRFLPYETTAWQVDYRLEAAPSWLILEITLTPIVNRPDQVAERRTALKAAKAEVLTWLEARGAAPGTYGVVWRPAEAERL